MLTDMAFKASREVIPAKIFKKADFDGDGLIDEAGYAVFTQLHND